MNAQALVGPILRVHLICHPEIVNSTKSVWNIINTGARKKESRFSSNALTSRRKTPPNCRARGSVVRMPEQPRQEEQGQGEGQQRARRAEEVAAPKSSGSAESVRKRMRK